MIFSSQDFLHGCSKFTPVNSAILALKHHFLPEQKLLELMVLLERPELLSHSLPSSSEKGESDRAEPLSFGRKGGRTKRGMRLRELPFSGDFFSCSDQNVSEQFDFASFQPKEGDALVMR